MAEQERPVALSDDLRSYIAAHGKATTAIGSDADAVIVGEYHGFFNSELAAVRTTAMTRLVRELLKDARYRYFANESFLNAGPVRKGLHEYWQRGTLPPTLDGDGQDMDVQEVGRRILVRRFQPILDDLKARPRFVLSIGSRQGGPVRDRRIAQHFFEEVLDRRMAPRTPGVTLLGMIHASATPYNTGQTTTRMHLEKRGHKCVSILVLTDFIHRGNPDDQVVPLDGPATATIRLASLAASSPISFPTNLTMPGGKPSPIRSIRFADSDSGRCLAEQFDHIVLQRA
jgi:hypothetical protein